MLLFRQKNLKQLMKGTIWFCDGTFKMSLTIFFQIFTILGSIVQIINDAEQTIALPLVYALLPCKEQIYYSKVFEVVISECSKLDIQVKLPLVVMSDFELPIINAVKTNILTNVIKGCFFHLCQNVHWRIQTEGLQEKYNHPTDNSIRNASHMLCALAFVHTEDVYEYFDLLY